MTTIVPTIGRVVLVRNRHANPKKDQPEGATVAFVHSDGMINVGGVDHNGLPFAMTSLLLVQEGDLIPEGGPYAEWMAYQKQVAKGEIPAVLHAQAAPTAGTLNLEVK
jgi:hypothetical protein